MVLLSGIVTCLIVWLLFVVVKEFACSAIIAATGRLYSEELFTLLLLLILLPTSKPTVFFIVGLVVVYYEPLATFEVFL